VPPRLVGTLAGLATAGTWRWLQGTEAAADPSWQRRNYRDREVTLLLGPAVVAGTAVGMASGSSRSRLGATAAVAAVGAIGAYDDRYGDAHAKGLRGHLEALRAGRVTTGMAKMLTMGAIAAALAPRRSRLLDRALGTALIAGGANLVNLLDLRPGRAAKVTSAAAIVLSRVGERPARCAAAAAGSAAAVALVPDVREQAMLGDCGASTLGAALGWSLAARQSRLTRLVGAAVIVAATLASERVSFSAVIDEHPVLRRLDALGRAR
jgi:UDP-N-acetylmuramyl pentapeptide phosphotransferase/UDP-N-acetylglucosamine-1-phosphate transferase